MQRLLFLSSISGLFASGCSDDCGPGGAPDTGIVASSAEVSLTFGNLSSGANNDCPDPAAPSGVVSLTLSGSQIAGTGLLTLCVPRPDQLATGSVPLGSGFRIIDLNGDANNCTFTIDTTRPPSGTATSSGMCDNGTNKAGYAITLDGAIGLRRTCGANIDSVAVTLVGNVAVAVP